MHVVIHQRHGFTLGEVILSSFLLTAGILSVSALITNAYRSSLENQDVIVASELAQEGVEIVRNVRDNNMIRKIKTGTPAEVFDGFPSGSSSRCSVDYDDTTLSCTGTPRTGLVKTGGFFQTIVSGDSHFERLVRIDMGPSPPTARVLSFVTWNASPDFSGSISRNISWCTLSHQCVYTEVFLTEWQ